MTKKQLFAAGLVSATLLCSTNTVTVHAQEQPQDNTAQYTLKNAASTTETVKTVQGTPGQANTDNKQDYNFPTSNPSRLLKADAKERQLKVTPYATVTPEGYATLNFKLEHPYIPVDISQKDLRSIGYDGIWWKKIYETETNSDGEDEYVDTGKIEYASTHYNFKILPGKSGLTFKTPTKQYTNGKLIKDFLHNRVEAQKNRTHPNYLATEEPIEYGMGKDYNPDVTELIEVTTPFKIGEKYQAEFPVTLEENVKGYLGNYGVPTTPSITIDRTQNWTIGDVKVQNGTATYQVNVTNTGNVAVNGHTITTPDGKQTKVNYGGKEALNPGETATTTITYPANNTNSLDLKVEASNIPAKTLKAEIPQITWGNLTFAGQTITNTTQLEVKANSQLLFQAEAENTGKVPVKSIDVTLPNGEKTTLNQTLEPGEKGTIKIPYTPAKGETKLVFKLSVGNPPQKEYTVNIKPETTLTTPKNTTPKNTTTPDTPKQNTNIQDLGTVHIPQLKPGGSFIPPINQLKNPTQKTLGSMYVVSEDKKYFSGIDDIDGIYLAKPGETFPTGILPAYRPNSEKVYEGKEKPKFTIYANVPRPGAGTPNLDYVEDFGTPIATFDVAVDNSLPNVDTMFGESHLFIGDKPVTEEIYLHPKKNAEGKISLEYPKRSDILSHQLSVSVNDRVSHVSQLKNNKNKFMTVDDFPISTPKNKDESFTYTVGSTIDDVIHAAGTFPVRDVTKDDSKVPQIKHPSEVKGAVYKNEGEILVLSTESLIKDQKITDVLDAEGNSYYSKNFFRYEAQKEDFEKPKRFYFLNENNIVVGKMDLKFKQADKSMLELKGETQHSGIMGQSFTQELVIRNYTDTVMNDATVVYYDSNSKGVKTRITSKKVPLNTPLNPGESTTIKVDVAPYNWPGSYSGVFELDDIKNASTDPVTFKIDQNSNDPVPTNEDLEKSAHLNVKARFKTNPDAPVRVMANRRNLC